MIAGLRSVKFQWHILLMALPWFAGMALADQAVYKCGQEITNQPNDPSQCQKLLISNPTQIEGTRVQNSQSPKPVSAATGTAAIQTQIERMARDLMALKRELSRHTSQLASVPSK